MIVLNLNCKMTNCYLVESGFGWIMIDTDFPETLHPFLSLLGQNDIKVSDIKYLIVTHFHPDHAGIAQELKNMGIGLIVHECQIPYINKLNDFFKKSPKFKHTEIVPGGNIVVSSRESRILLKGVGIDGELIPTPGHSADSVSLIIDENCAFTGDLPRFDLIEGFDDDTIKESWETIKDYKITNIFPAHGNTYTLI